MNVRDRLDGEIAIVELDGRLTMTDHPGRIKDVISDAVRRGAKHVFLDLSRVQYIDSTRLGELIASHVTVTRRGGRLKLVATPPRVAELLTIAGLTSVFDRYDSLDEAKASLGDAL